MPSLENKQTYQFIYKDFPICLEYVNYFRIIKRTGLKVDKYKDILYK